MQDIETSSPKSLNNEMSPYLGSKYESPISSRSPSPNLRGHPNQSAMEESTKYMSDDEISVGCPSPALQPNYRHRSRESTPSYSTTTTCRCPEDAEDYFKPLKKLKMVEVETDRRISPTVEIEDRPDGVKSFSIVDILNHKPSKPQCNRIVRPWDIDPEVEAHQQRLESFHRQLKVQQLALLRPEFAAFNVSYTSETGSDRSSSVASDCCSPDIVPPSAQRQRQQQQGKLPGATPLDALFQMTSKTFDSSAGESSAGRQYYFFSSSLNILKLSFTSY
ncbi:hypothetical protein NQ314_004282 [Rhamnusium bicolor]|uniref:Uncharacterized protein n=1 Tax=Rhamnusium bicolor TaxID=1586634 RepID=A0AAV8ZLH4_9CUCU|nr:hypothetical protein NQ314_004282 [Rhamnusium bicolor]